MISVDGSGALKGTQTTTLPGGVMSHRTRVASRLMAARMLGVKRKTDPALSPRQLAPTRCTPALTSTLTATATATATNRATGTYMVVFTDDTVRWVR